MRQFGNIIKITNQLIINKMERMLKNGKSNNRAIKK
jgi:hypothetical protein